MAPGADKVGAAAVGVAVVLGVNVEEAGLGDALARGVLGQGAQVEHAQARAVVALVREAVDDELVVVDAEAGALEVARLLGRAQVANVPKVRHRVAVGGRADAVVLVVLVVQHQELLPCRVGHPALVGV